MDATQTPSPNREFSRRPPVSECPSHPALASLVSMAASSLPALGLRYMENKVLPVMEIYSITSEFIMTTLCSEI